MKVTAAESKVIAEKHFAQWFESAGDFYKTYKYHLSKNMYKLAAFDLHQATERFYSCLLLVLTNYKPYTHNLALFNTLAILQNEKIAEVFPQDNKMQRSRFQLLKNAYVDARYSEHYEITQEELIWLAGRVECLQQLTEKLCREKIESFVAV